MLACLHAPAFAQQQKVANATVEPLNSTIESSNPRARTREQHDHAVLCGPHWYAGTLRRATDLLLLATHSGCEKSRTKERPHTHTWKAASTSLTTKSESASSAPHLSIESQRTLRRAAESRRPEDKDKPASITSTQKHTHTSCRVRQNSSTSSGIRRQYPEAVRQGHQDRPGPVSWPGKGSLTTFKHIHRPPAVPNTPMPLLRDLQT
jgi:hypothetical protein